MDDHEATISPVHSDDTSTQPHLPASNATPAQRQTFWVDWLQTLLADPEQQYARLIRQKLLYQQQMKDALPGVADDVARQATLELAEENLTHPFLATAYGASGQESDSENNSQSGANDRSRPESVIEEPDEKKLQSFWVAWLKRQADIAGPDARFEQLPPPGSEQLAILEASLDLRFKRFQRQSDRYEEAKTKNANLVSEDYERLDKLGREEKSLEKLCALLGQTLEQRRADWSTQLLARQSSRMAEKKQRRETRNLEADVNDSRQQVKNTLAEAEIHRQRIVIAHWKLAAYLPQMEERLRLQEQRRDQLRAVAQPDEPRSPELELLDEETTRRRKRLNVLATFRPHERPDIPEQVETALEAQINTSLERDREAISPTEREKRELDLRERLLDQDQLRLRQLAVGAPLRQEPSDIWQLENRLARQERLLLNGLSERLAILRQTAEGEPQTEMLSQLPQTSEKLATHFDERRQRLETRLGRLAGEIGNPEGMVGVGAMEPNWPEEVLQIRTRLQLDVRTARETLLEDALWRVNQLSEDLRRQGSAPEALNEDHSKLQQGLQSLAAKLSERREDRRRAMHDALLRRSDDDFVSLSSANREFRVLRHIIDNQLANPALDNMPEEKSLLQKERLIIQEHLDEVRVALSPMVKQRYEADSQSLTTQMARRRKMENKLQGLDKQLQDLEDPPADTVDDDDDEEMEQAVERGLARRLIQSDRDRLQTQLGSAAHTIAPERLAGVRELYRIREEWRTENESAPNRRQQLPEGSTAMNAPASQSLLGEYKEQVSEWMYSPNDRIDAEENIQRLEGELGAGRQQTRDRCQELLAQMLGGEELLQQYQRMVQELPPTSIGHGYFELQQQTLASEVNNAPRELQQIHDQMEGELKEVQGLLKSMEELLTEERGQKWAWQLLAKSEIDDSLASLTDRHESLQEERRAISEQRRQANGLIARSPLANPAPETEQQQIWTEEPLPLRQGSADHSEKIGQFKIVQLEALIKQANDHAKMLDLALAYAEYLLRDKENGWRRVTDEHNPAASELTKILERLEQHDTLEIIRQESGQLQQGAQAIANDDQSVDAGKGKLADARERIKDYVTNRKTEVNQQCDVWNRRLEQLQSAQASPDIPPEEQNRKKGKEKAIGNVDIVGEELETGPHLEPSGEAGTTATAAPPGLPPSWETLGQEAKDYVVARAIALFQEAHPGVNPPQFTAPLKDSQIPFDKPLTNATVIDNGTAPRLDGKPSTGMGLLLITEVGKANATELFVVSVRPQRLEKFQNDESIHAVITNGKMTAVWRRAQQESTAHNLEKPGRGVS